MLILKKTIQIMLLLFTPVAFVQAAQNNFALKLVPVIGMILSETSTNVKKTGQTESYDENGTLANDGSVKDDGYYKKGVTPNYSRDSAEQIVTDRFTGLMWQDDSGALTEIKPWLTQTNYDICTGNNGQIHDASKCNDTSGDTSTTYCNNLTLGGYTDWRLPTSQELESIVNHSKYNGSIDPIFQFFGSINYASSTTYVLDGAVVLAVNFGYGFTFDPLKNNSSYVRCVRGLSTQTANLSRDNAKQIITDTTTRLQWQDDADAKNITKKWKGAVEYCEALNLGGHTDWRLPNINEFKTILNRTTFPAIATGFTNTFNDYYWSSTTLPGAHEYAFVVQFGNSTVDKYQKNSNIYCRIRCVRDSN